MPNYYTYIIASLPVLNFEGKPAISSRKFLAACAGLTEDKEISLLGAILEDKELPASDYAVLKAWLDFDAALRNELVKHRSPRKRKDPHKYIRENPYWSPDIIHAAMAAYKDTSVLDAEKILDLARWRYLDELCAGHFFDFAFLIIYALKLKILERWEKVRTADRKGLLEGVLN